MKYVWRFETRRCASVAAAAPGELEGAGARRDRDGRPGTSRRRQPLRADEASRESSAAQHTYPIAGRTCGASVGCGFAAALCQRPRPPPVKAARSPKTRPRVRSAPTLEPSNDERLPPSALANSSSCTAKSARATTKRWPSSQQLEPRAPRPSRGAAGCPPVHLMNCSHPAVRSANNQFASH